MRSLGKVEMSVCGGTILKSGVMRGWMRPRELCGGMSYLPSRGNHPLWAGMLNEGIYDVNWE
jgi:hypothetical protein